MFDIHGNDLSKKVFMPLETGNIAETTGCVSRTYSYIGNMFRTAYPLEVDSGSVIDFEVLGDTTGIKNIAMFEYAADMSFIKYTMVENGVPALDGNTKYIKFKVRYNENGHEPDGLIVLVDRECKISKNLKTASQCEYTVYEVYPGIYTAGALLLPPNYKPDGKPVPLLVFVHGSNGFATWNTEMGALSGGSTYFPYMEYLSNEGFAVFDCFGITTKYANSADYVDGNNTFVSHIALSAYVSGIKYVVSRYNIDKDDLNVYAKSLGGGIAAMLANDSHINIKTVSMFCPYINNMTTDSTGWTVAKRTMLADDWGLEGDVSGVFLSSNFSFRSESGQAFMRLNLPHVAQMNPGWDYIGRTIEQKFGDAVARDYNKTDYYRNLCCPVKIWCAEDDDSIIYDTLTEYIAQCQNAGKDATMRAMPTGTGGHHSVDTDSNALKSSGTTALGISYSNIPTAYVEMVSFIRSRARR